MRWCTDANLWSAVPGYWASKSCSVVVALHSPSSVCLSVDMALVSDVGGWNRSDEKTKTDGDVADAVREVEAANEFTGWN